MSDFIIKLALQSKLKKINRIIDQKIKQGKSYQRESRLHRSITRQMRTLSHI